MNIKVLIIDDDRTVCASLNLLLKKKGFLVEAIHSPNIAMDKIGEFQPDLILLDMNFTIDTSGRQGIRLLELIRESYKSISIILMTGWATVQLAVRGMKLGAKDFIAKPWDNKSLLISIDNILQLYHSDKKEIDDELGEEHQIIGESSEIKKVLSLIKKVARTDAAVLITGESGTGKELVAEAIHNGSRRSSEPFVKVNLGGVPTSLFESEMFGHRKGAFTGANNDREGRFSKAQNGTIFLDEIGELDLANQVKMLRVLQEKTFEALGSSDTIKSDVRIVSATNRNLVEMSAKGNFREDLFYRINLLHIHLPTLTERKTDIPILVKYFINNIAILHDIDSPIIEKDALDWISNQEYKGNIRQLKNIVTRTFLLNMDKKTLSRTDFLSSFDFDNPMKPSSDGLNLQKLEVETIKKALSKHNHSISATAAVLGITRSSLYRRLEKFGIKHEPKI